VVLFDQHSVSFVSVTQSFNTTSSMGRLTLDVLLSFTQFEREVIGERVRDKIAASKRKGMWVGGPVPLGYATVNQKLVIVPEEAGTVRTMFRLYLECGSVGALAEELARRNIHSKVRTFASGRVRGGGLYSVGALAHFLKNRFYIGEVVYRVRPTPGSMPPSSIVPPSKLSRPSLPTTLEHGGCTSKVRPRSLWAASSTTAAIA
jgi:site-specific DNA recombinase